MSIQGTNGLQPWLAPCLRQVLEPQPTQVELQATLVSSLAGA